MYRCLRGVSRLVLLALFIVTGSARAGPYEFVAIYKAVTGGGTMEHVLKKGDVIPDEGAGWVLSSVKLRMKKSPADAISLSNMKRVRVAVSRGAPQAEPQWVQAEVPKDDEKEVLAWDGTGNTDLWAVPIQLDVRVRLSTEFLCGQETLLRNTKGKARCSAIKDRKYYTRSDDVRSIDLLLEQQNAANGSTEVKSEECTSEPGDFFNAGIRPTRAILSKLSSGPEVVFSFCDSLNSESKSSAERGQSNVDWDKLLVQYPSKGDESAKGKQNAREQFANLTFGLDVKDGDSLKEVHKKKLVELLLPGIRDAMGGVGSVALDSADPKTGYHSEVAIHDSFPFVIVRGGRLLNAFEVSGQGELPLSEIVDDESQLRVDAISGLEKQIACGRVFGPLVTIRFEGADEKGNPVKQKLTPDFGSGCVRYTKPSLRDFLGRSAVLAAYYTFEDGTELLLWKSNVFTIRHLGLITTFPVVTEIVAAARGTPVKDPLSTSSIPISWAVRMGRETDGRYTAVTFPWKFSVNTRQYPELAKYIAVYPHLSVVTGVTQAGGEPPLFITVGAGLSVAEVFHISYAWAPSPPAGGSSNFLLVGVGIQDIVKLAQ